MAAFSDVCRNCRSCGMDMDMEPYCVNPEVLALRTAETGRQYPWGLDVNPAFHVCSARWFQQRE